MKEAAGAMRIDVYTPLLLSLLLAFVSPRVGLRLAPAPAARALTAAAVVWPLGIAPQADPFVLP